MHLTKELFIIPNEKDYILYAPLKGKALSVNGGTVNLLKKVSSGEELPRTGVLEELVSEGIVVEQEEPEPIFNSDTDTPFKPTSVTLFPTTNCNLRCIYCYSSAGENPVNMDWEVAKAAVDFVVENALETQTKQVRLTFHGGGEPLYPKVFANVQAITEYFRETACSHNLNSRISVSTNGIFSPKVASWVAKNIDSVQFSFDGPREIQDRQRPLAKGKGSSYEQVFRSTQLLRGLGKPFHVRATITKESCSSMEEIVEFFAKEIKPTTVSFEPIQQSGRCFPNHLQNPSVKDYLRHYLITKAKADQLGLPLFASGLKSSFVTYYCSAYGNGFFINSNGEVTSCVVLADTKEPRSSYFIFGHYDSESNRFLFDYEKLAAQRNRRINNNQYCKDCFVKYNCGGGCLARADLQETTHIPSEYKCEIIRNYAISAIKEAFSLKQGGQT